MGDGESSLHDLDKTGITIPAGLNDIPYTYMYIGVHYSKATFGYVITYTHHDIHCNTYIYISRRCDYCWTGSGLQLSVGLGFGVFIRCWLRVCNILQPPGFVQHKGYLLGYLWDKIFVYGLYMVFYGFKLHFKKMVYVIGTID